MKISKMQIAIYLMIAAGFILSVAFYDKLPENMATHWNAKGQIDGYMPKSDGAFFGPVMMVIMAALFMLIPRIPPLRSNFEKFRIYYEGFTLFLMTILLIGNIWVLLWNVGIKASANLIMPVITVMVGGSFFFLGMILRKIKRNWFIGVRTPWTLSNEVVWKRTHEFSGPLFVVAGLVTMAGALFGQLAIWFILVPVIAASIVATVYSYVIYKKVQAGGYDGDAEEMGTDNGSGDSTWDNLKQGYLRQVERSLMKVPSPRKKEVLEDVACHLDQKFSELTLIDKTWENFQQIITEMGPAEDYAELLSPDSHETNTKKFPLAKILTILIVAGLIWLLLPSIYKVIRKAGFDTRQVDEIKLPFVDDPEVIGTWKSVDFVSEMEQFKVGEKQWRGGELYLKELVFLPNGKTFKPWWNWTRGVVTHSGDKTAAKYHIQEFDGEKYMFFEWKSGDYTIRHMKPAYYVLKKVSSKTSTLKPNFKTTLPNGVTVELVGVCDFNLEHQQCWGPNGEDIGRALFVTESTNGSKEHNDRAKGFILHTNIPSEIQWQKALGQTDWFCCSTVVDDQGNKLGRDNYYGKKMWLDGRNKTDLSIKIAPKKWQTKGVYDGKYVIGKADKHVRFIESYDSAEGLKVVFQSDFSDKEIRLDALVKGSGQTVITAKISQVTDSLGNKNDVAIFDSMSLAQIRNFQFKIRPKMETVTFKNVSLKPDFKTDVGKGNSDVRDIQRWVEKVSSLKDHKRAAFVVVPQLLEEPGDVALRVVQEAWPKVSDHKARQGILKAFHFAKHQHVLAILDLGVRDTHGAVVTYALTYVSDYSGVKFSGFGDKYVQWYEQSKDKTPAQIFLENKTTRNPEFDKAIEKMVANFKKGTGRAGWAEVATLLGKSKYAFAIPVMIGMIDADNSYDTIYWVGYFGLYRITGVSYSPFHDGSWWRRWWQKNKANYPEQVRRASVPDLPKTSHGSSFTPYPEDIDTPDGMIRWMMTHHNALKKGYPDWSAVAGEFMNWQDLKAIPYLIAAMDADANDKLTYDIGYHGLDGLTGVPYDSSHDAEWWKDWWEKNKGRYPEEVKAFDTEKIKQEYLKSGI